MHLQALTSSKLQVRTQAQSVMKQLRLGRLLSLFEVFLCRRRDLFLRLLFLFTGSVLREFSCEFLLWAPRCSAKNSRVNNANPLTSSLKNFFNMFFCYLCDRYIFFFSFYNPENCQKLVRMCSSCCTKFR